MLVLVQALRLMGSKNDDVKDMQHARKLLRPAEAQACAPDQLQCASSPRPCFSPLWQSERRAQLCSTAPHSQTEASQ